MINASLQRNRSNSFSRSNTHMMHEAHSVMHAQSCTHAHAFAAVTASSVISLIRGLLLSYSLCAVKLCENSAVRVSQSSAWHGTCSHAASRVNHAADDRQQ